MKQEEIEMQIWDYIDGTCSKADHLRISSLIIEDSTWKQTHDELIALHAGISKNLEAEEPSMRFTKNVMDAVAGSHMAPATKKYVNNWVIRGIAAFFMITIVAVFGYALYSSSGSYGSHFKFDLNLGSIFNTAFFNGFIMLNIVLGLVFIDAVLRRKNQDHYL